MLAPSTRVGRYEIKSALGKGGMGSLYIARDPNIDRLVALKLLSAHLDSDELKARFALEARALASLNHPNIVDIYDSGQFRGTPFIVMEFVRGETLEEMIRRSAPLSLSRKLKLGSELCAGLAHAHEAGVIHRDIKPANLMVEDRSQRLKIVDFGIARVTEDLSRSSRMTKVNMQIGTPGYMSPEQIEGGAIDQRSDIFAVGVVLYELLSNSTAFPGNSTRQIERKVLEEEPPSLTSLVPDLDPAIQAIVDRALQKSPDRRYQSALELAEALDAVQERRGKSESGLRARPTPAPAGTGKPSPPPVGKSSKAETAHQRCLIAYAEGAVDAAKRFAVEALVEDPGHAEARAFIQKVDPKLWVPPPPPKRGTVPPTAVARGPEPPKTQVAGSDVIEPTLLAGRRSEQGSWDATASDSASQSWDPYARTIVGRPGGETTGGAPWAGPEAKPSAGAGFDPTLLIPRRDQASDWGSASQPDSQQPTWDPYERTIIGPAPGDTAPRRSSGPQIEARPVRRRMTRAAAAWALGAVLLVGVASAATWFLLFSGEDGLRLTIEKPEGGTISTDRLVCGSAGDACTATLEVESVVEFEVTPDTGFKFAGFVGDCAPGGRTRMTGPKSCGATFEKIPDVPAAKMATLTITPATGGTVVGSGIACGGANKICSAQHQVGTVVTLSASADEGYSFKGFMGECGTGRTFKTALNGPITCGARFEITRPLAGTNPPPPGVPNPTGEVRPPPVIVPGPGPNVPSPPVSGGGSGAGGGGDDTSKPDIGGTTNKAGPTAPPKDERDYAKEREEAEKKAAEEAKKAAEEARKAAEQAIEKTLGALPRAFGDLDFTAIQRVFPTAPNTIREQFRQYDTLAYSYTGKFDFKQLDAAAGRAVVEVDAKQAWKPKAGNKQEAEFQVTFELSKREDYWLINSWKVKQKKK